MNSQSSPTDSPTSIDRPRASGNLIVLSGPSGVGKGTVVEGLFEKVPAMKRSVSVTTRSCREGETDGVDYFFLSPAEFEQRRKDGDLLEWAEFAGACYGTPRAWVVEQLKSGLDVLLVIEVQGARQIRQLVSQAILIFLSPPSFEALEERLRGRGTESPEKIAIRLKKAQQEMQEKELFDYEVVNDIVSVAVENLAHIIYAERLRVRTEKK
jgi:guanylate kinase